MTRRLRTQLCAFFLLAAGATLAGNERLPEADYVRDSCPSLFSYQELVQLSLDQPLSPELSEKLHKMTTTPFISNEAYYNGAGPRRLDVDGIGSSVRVAFWNIERGIALDDIGMFLTDKNRFRARVEAERKEAKGGDESLTAEQLAVISDQIDALKAADIWVLNEVDWGMKRSHYRAVARELARLLNMNWAYGVEFVEIDPKQLGTATFDDVKDEGERKALLEEFSVDKERLRALHGTAVLSRYPIRAARAVPFKMGYDWFKESSITRLEKLKRKAGYFVGEELLIESRRGGRMTLYVDLDVPEAPGKTVTIAATHLENRAKPKIRRRQMNAVLEEVRHVANPVIIAGDMNTTGSDSTPTSVSQMLYKRYGSTDFWTTKGVQWVTGLGPLYTASKTFRKLTGIQTRIDPTASNVPGFSPNLEKGLFKDLEKFRFVDGRAIDFRGDRERTVDGGTGTLGNSNARGGRGFVPTFTTLLVWGSVAVARFKLDWILVKSDIRDPRAKGGSYLFAPHFPRVLTELNQSLTKQISDHSPLTVDLPFKEPAGLAAARK